MIDTTGLGPGDGSPPLPTSGFGRRAPGQNVHLGWSQPAGLLGLSFINAGLKMATLGIYQFWGKTEVRKRIWTAARINGEPLEYTGTGKELFIGFLFVFGAVLLPLLLLSVVLAFAFGPTGQVLGQTIFFAVYLYLFGVGVYRAQRYRLTRTRWRGIRGALVGSPWWYGFTALWTGMLIPVTMGWIYPWRATKLQKLQVENMRFGDRPFTFEENSGPLYGRFIALWLSALVGILVASAGIATITATNMIAKTAKEAAHLSPRGVLLMAAFLLVMYLFAIFASSWYRAGQFNHFARSTTFEGAQFKGTMTGTGLLWLTISNFLIVISSLGILMPIAQVRAARYFVQNLQIEGNVSFDAIAQAAADGVTQGEGLAQAFDFDAF
jgi:uncharacterized membrane protein YjgN (DUF898 family)